MNRRLALIGICCTAAWLLLILLYVVLRRMGIELIELKPHELGDFLAGVIGPVGILWLILGFFQQAQELRENSRALDLQSQELRNSSHEQRELMHAIRAQVEADRATVALAREQHALNLLPRFSFLDPVLVTHAAGAELRFDLRNLGANASEVRLAATPALVPPLPPRLPVVLTGVAYSCVLNFAAGHPAPGDRLSVGFRDLAGHHGTAHLKFEFDQSGALVELMAAGGG